MNFFDFCSFLDFFWFFKKIMCEREASIKKTFQEEKTEPLYNLEFTAFKFNYEYLYIYN